MKRWGGGIIPFFVCVCMHTSYYTYAYTVSCGEIAQFIATTDMLANEASYSYMVGSRKIDPPPSAESGDDHMKQYLTHLDSAKGSLHEVWVANACEHTNDLYDYKKGLRKPGYKNNILY